MAGRGGRPGHRADVASGGLVEVLDVGDDALAVEIDGGNAAILDLRKAHRHVHGRLGDVIPGIVVEGADIGRRTQEFSHIVTCAQANLDLFQLLGAGQVAAHGAVARASGDGHAGKAGDEEGLSRAAGEAKDAMETTGQKRYLRMKMAAVPHVDVQRGYAHVGREGCTVANPCQPR